jgi:CRP-like cAMP-binding protein
MEPEDKTRVLSGVDLFKSLEAGALARLAEDTEGREYRAGQLLFAQGTSADELWIVVDGTVELSVSDAAGDEEVISTRGRAEAFGEAALYDDGPRMVSARAVGDVHVLVLDADRFRNLLRENPEVAEALLRLMASVIRASTHRN